MTSQFAILLFEHATIGFQPEKPADGDLHVQRKCSCSCAAAPPSACMPTAPPANSPPTVDSIWPKMAFKAMATVGVFTLGLLFSFGACFVIFAVSRAVF